MGACLCCLNNEDPLDDVNGTLITLILKVSNANNVTNFRPISLCNIIYKIVTKSLANRFRLVLRDVISKAQSAFELDRLITNNTIIGFECNHALETRERKKGYVAIKLDVSKAYDRVEWGFLSAMMLKLGFSGAWIDRVIRYVSSVSFCFLINGDICGSLKPSRGLRQWDLLSPYMFLLCVEGLSCLINKAVLCGDIIGYRCCSTGHFIYHLFFVDNNLLFARADSRIVRLLRVF